MMAAQVEVIELDGGVAITADANGEGMPWPGGRGQFEAWGTWGGGTLDLQYLARDETTWLTIGGDCQLIANGAGLFELAPGKIRFSLNGASSPSLNIVAMKF